MNPIYLEPNQQEELQEKYVTEVIERSLGYISAHYEHPEDPRARLDYHNTAHTLDVIDRIEALLRILAPGSIQHGRLLAAGHDRVQHWTDVTKMVNGYPVTTKKRTTGLNERASAYMVAADMRYINNKQGLVFPEALIAQLEADISITIPLYDQQLGTVRQPNFTPESSMEAKALALADLGGGAMQGGAYFVEEGNRNFREMNSDITEYVRRFGFELSKHCAGSRGYYDSLRDRFLADAASQVRFAQGRMALLPQELGMLPGQHMVEVARLMSRLPEAVHAAEASLYMRGVMTLDEIVADVYKTSPFLEGYRDEIEKRKVYRILS